MLNKIVSVVVIIITLSSGIFAESLVVQLMHKNKTPGQDLTLYLRGINGNSFHLEKITNSSGISRIQLPVGSYKIQVINKVENLTIFSNQQNYKVIIIP
jgi:hypothetical protein